MHITFFNATIKKDSTLRHLSWCFLSTFLIPLKAICKRCGGGGGKNSGSVQAMSEEERKIAEKTNRQSQPNPVAQGWKWSHQWAILHTQKKGKAMFPRWRFTLRRLCYVMCCCLLAPCCSPPLSCPGTHRNTVCTQRDWGTDVQKGYWDSRGQRDSINKSKQFLGIRHHVHLTNGCMCHFKFHKLSIWIEIDFIKLHL